MKVRRWLTIPAAALIAASTSGVAHAASDQPGAPVAVSAVSQAGSDSLYVFWTPATTQGGSPILYYVASTFWPKQNHRCVGPNPGSNVCKISGVDGSRLHHVMVWAVNSAGPGHATTAWSYILHPAGRTPAEAAATGSSPTGPASANLPLSADGSSSQAGSAGTSTQTAPGGTTTPADASAQQLPFTGADLPTLLVAGLGLFFGGLLLATRRRHWRRVARWFFSI